MATFLRVFMLPNSEANDTLLLYSTVTDFAKLRG